MIAKKDKLLPNLSKLKFDNVTSSWISPQGLIYELGSVHGNRVLHIADHLHPNPLKPLHTLFNVESNELIALLDEVWLAKQGSGVLQNNGCRTFESLMGRVVGLTGETKIKIVVRDGTTRIITAYPIP